jgi:hypothetical protein
LYDTNQEEIMKSKAFGKKLTLNKKTVADLNIDKMMNVQGGRAYIPQWTETCEITGGCCPTECSCNPSGEPACPCESVKEM